MRRQDLIEGVLTDACEALQRWRRRTGPIRPGWPVRFVLDQHRAKLIGAIFEDNELRTYLRGRLGAAGDEELFTADVSELDKLLAASSDPRRFIATALVAPDAAKSEWAGDLVLHPDRIPPPLISDLPGEDRIASTTLEGEALLKADDSVPGAGDENTGVAGGSDKADEPTAGSRDSQAQVASSPTVRVRQARGPKTTPISSVLAAIPADMQDLNAARRRIKKLEFELSEAKAKIPSRAERRRGRLVVATNVRLTAELALSKAIADALSSERAGLLERTAFAEQAAAEAQQGRDSAETQRRAMANRLGDARGRADYLRRVLPSEITDLVQQLTDVSFGKERSRIARKLDDFRRLSDAIDTAFPSGEVLPQQEPAAQGPRRAARVGASRELSVVPIGGGQEIGGSALLVRVGGKRILIDAGMRMDGTGPARIAEVVAEGLDLVVVTHAHHDHAGYIPKLVDQVPRLKVVTTQSTKSLLPTMWADSVKVMKRQWETQSAYGAGRPPLYGDAEVEAAEAAIVSRPYGRTMLVDGGIELTLFPAGHILGAAGVVIRAGDRKVVVTGDITSRDQRQLSVVSTAIPAALVAGANLLVIESTYCHGEHRSRDDEVADFVRAVEEVVDAGGRVLVPAFGLGRSQEVAMILAQHLPEVEVVVDGLARQITQIYEEDAAIQQRSLSIFTGRVRPVDQTLREVRTFQRGVIVTTSGMLTGGPALAWARAILPDPHAALFLCGYQDEESPGRHLLELASASGRGRRAFELPDADGHFEHVAVEAVVRRYTLSAHADRSGLVDIIEHVNPSATMLVHGQRGHQTQFRASLGTRGLLTVPTDDWVVV